MLICKTGMTVVPAWWEIPSTRHSRGRHSAPAWHRAGLPLGTAASTLGLEEGLGLVGLRILQSSVWPPTPLRLQTSHLTQLLYLKMGITPPVWRVVGRTNHQGFVAAPRFLPSDSWRCADISVTKQPGAEAATG